MGNLRFDEFKQACKNFFRKRKKYFPELETLLTENFHIQAAWKRENSIVSSIKEGNLRLGLKSLQKHLAKIGECQ